MQLFNLILLVFVAQIAAFAPTSNNRPTFSRSELRTEKYNILDAFGSMISNFGKQARASHILIGPRDWDSEEEARERLIRLKDEIGNDPAKFAEAASRISGYPSAKKGGDLGFFGPGQMVKTFDKVVFSEEVGVVHGPISTQFGEHLILISERTGEN